MGIKAQAIVKPRASLWAGVLIGIGTMAAVDEIIFHQILGWHHFYDGSTPAIGLLTDGLLHAAELIAIVAGFFMLVEQSNSRTLNKHWVGAGFFTGAGAFQLFDGIVNHKLLRIHQIRYDVPILPYDLTWNFFALLLLAIGFIWIRRARLTDLTRT